MMCIGEILAVTLMLPTPPIHWDLFPYLKMARGLTHGPMFPKEAYFSPFRKMCPQYRIDS